MEIKSNALLRHLLDMPPAAIYALADKVHLFNGFELCKRMPVSELTWSSDGTTLKVALADDGRVVVSLSLANGELSSSCNCGVWSPRGRCPHVVASLATVKKAISPASLPMLKIPQPYLDKVRTEVLSVTSGSGFAGMPSGAEGYSLVLDRVEEKIRYRLFRGAVPVTLFEPELPPSIRDFVRSLQTPLPGKRVQEFLARFGGRFPVLYSLPEALLPLTYSAAVQRTLVLHLDLHDEELRVTSTLEDGSSFDDKSFVADGYHIDLRDRYIERVDDSAAGVLNRLRSALRLIPSSHFTEDAGEIRFVASSLNEAQFDLTAEQFAGFLKRSSLTVEGEVVLPRTVEPQYRLNIVELADPVRLVAEGVADGHPFSISRDMFWFFPAAARQHFPQPLRARKRITAIINACFATLTGKSRAERERLVRLALDSPDFAKRGVKSEARRIITSFFEKGGERRTLLQLFDRDWLAVAADREREGTLLEIPYELFGVDIFSEADTPGELVIDRKLFMKNLARLRAALMEGGFSLAIGGEELETVSWSFTLDATRSSIDWFELRPEIRFEGELVQEDELAEALRGGGLFRSGSRMLILDEESSRALSLFAGKTKRDVVRIPRLQILDWIALRRSGVRVLLSPEDERILESLTHFDRVPQLRVPLKLKATLRNYQREGYSWLAFLYEHRFGACLADDMGLGKTIQAIALLAGLAEGVIASEVPSGVPHLVVVPPSLIFNWESEIARFYPSFNVGVYRGQGRQADFSGLDVVLTSYGVIQRDIETLKTLPFNVIVFDEAQAVKNIHAETTGAVRRLKARFKVTLTGTPVENHLGEYYSVMDLALPGLLGPYEQFRKQMGREGDDFMQTLIRRTHPFILRRAKDMIRAELPPKVETDLYLEMSPRQKALYVRTVAQVKATVAEAYSSNAPGQARIIALTAILKLRQICLSSKLLLHDANDRSPKVDLLIDQLHELFAEGHSVLVFSQFTSFLDVVEEGFVQSGIRFFRLDGSTGVKRRKELVEEFQASTEPSVFLLSLKAGGRGLNLTRASYVFHLDPWWNPAVESQASDRAHRIGQTRQVTITRLLMRHSIEEKMMELKKRKLKLYRALLEDAEHEGTSSIGREDFEFLLG
jgi:hypothetical protein